MSTAIVRTDCPALELLHRGKVRDVYALDDRLLIVATDRISAFDVVLERIAHGRGTAQDLDILVDTCDNILGRSFCALGDGATSPITSAMGETAGRPRSEANLPEVTAAPLLSPGSCGCAMTSAPRLRA